MNREDLGKRYKKSLHSVFLQSFNLMIVNLAMTCICMFCKNWLTAFAFVSIAVIHWILLSHIIVIDKLRDEQNFEEINKSEKENTAKVVETLDEVKKHAAEEAMKIQRISK